MSDPDRGSRAQGRPDYKVYRSRPGFLDRLGGGGSSSGLKQRLRRHGPTPPGRRPSKGRGGRREITPRRVAKWVALAIVFWLALSFVLFMLSAQIESGVDGSTERALASGGSTLTGSNILVLGSDARGGASIDKTASGPSRSDSILLLHVALGSVRKLSIPRDSLAAIPGHDTEKINAAFALGGAGLTIQTVEQFLGNGLKINHVMEVDFKDFPKLIDAMGGITVDNKSRICAPQFDNFYKGFHLPKGEQHLDGRRALGFARVRKNRCAPAENDLARAARQQEVLSAIRNRALSPGTFIRLPWVGWAAPKTIKTDMAGPGLFGLFADLATGNSNQTDVLKPYSLNGGADGTSLLVSDSEKHDAVSHLLNGK